jgi:protein TonB
MTSHEILQSNMLDILFENRNKQYGAYALRKYYANRMGIALAISFSSVLLLFFLFLRPSPSSATIIDTEGPIVQLTDIELPKAPEDVPPPPAEVKPPVVEQRAQVDYQNIAIVPDELADPPLPTIDDIELAVVSNTTVEGTPDITNQPAAPIANDGGGTAPAQNTEPAPPVFDPIEKQPEYPGGVEAWRNFLSRYLQAPDELAAGERRTVQVRFMVSATGEVTHFEIVQSAGTSFDREVLRVMKKMPKWTPAIQNGHQIAVSFVQPVTFQGIEE